MPAIDKQAQRGDTTDFPVKSLRAVRATVTMASGIVALI